MAEGGEKKGEIQGVEKYKNYKNEVKKENKFEKSSSEMGKNRQIHQSAKLERVKTRMMRWSLTI